MRPAVLWSSERGVSALEASGRCDDMLDRSLTWMGAAPSISKSSCEEL